MSEKHENLLVGHDVFYGSPGFSQRGIIVGVETNWELGVRYYRIKLQDGTERTARASEILPPY